MGFFTDTMSNKFSDPTGLTAQYAGNLKGLAGQPDYGYAQVRAPMVGAAFDAAQKRYEDAIVNRAKNQAAEGGWGISATQKGPAASRIAKGFKDLQTDRAMAELGQQNQWQTFVGNQIPSAISATQNASRLGQQLTTPSVASQITSPFISQFGRELAPGVAAGLVSGMKTGYEGLRDYFGSGGGVGDIGSSGVSATPENLDWLGQGADVPWDWGFEAVEQPSALAETLNPDLWENVFDWGADALF